MGDEQPTSREELIPRIGTFLNILGIFSFILFLASDFANTPKFDWLFAGIVLMGIGFLFRRRAAPPPSSGRFGMVRKMRENAKNAKKKR